jgi:methylaspartate ammonia-lyase
MTTVEKPAPTRFDVVATPVTVQPGMGVDEAVAITWNEMQRVCM